MRSAATALCSNETAVVIDSRIAPVPLVELKEATREPGGRGGVRTSVGRRFARGGEVRSSVERRRRVVDCRLEGREGSSSSIVVCEDGDGPADASEADEVRLEAPDGRLFQSVPALDESVVIVDAYELRRVMLELIGPSSERTWLLGNQAWWPSSSPFHQPEASLVRTRMSWPLRKDRYVGSSGCTKS